MLSRNDNPNIDGFNFSVDSVFYARISEVSSVVPPVENDFLLLDGTNFLLLDNTNFLLLG